MLEVSNVRVYDLEESVIACRNAKRIEMPEYTEDEFEASLPRAISLAQSKMGSGHGNFLSGIVVSFDVKYPCYWSPEFQRYHFAQIVTSSSKMHKLSEMDFVKCCNKYVRPEVMEMMSVLVDEYNMASECGDKEQKYKAYMRLVSNCPMGLELFMRVSTNYLQLKTIYHQRKNHKLAEDWGAFCAFVESLPYAKEFITG